MERITATIPRKTLDDIKRVAGPRGVSRFLAAWFDEMDAKYGKPSPKLVRKIDREMRAIFGDLPRRPL